MQPKAARLGTWRAAIAERLGRAEGTARATPATPRPQADASGVPRMAGARRRDPLAFETALRGEALGGRCPRARARPATVNRA